MILEYVHETHTHRPIHTVRIHQGLCLHVISYNHQNTGLTADAHVQTSLPFIYMHAFHYSVLFTSHLFV